VKFTPQRGEADMVVMAQKITERKDRY
jgi:hypothetical protein